MKCCVVTRFNAPASRSPERSAMWQAVRSEITASHFSVHQPGSASSVRARLLEVASLAAAAARRFGFKLHAGISQGLESTALTDRYREALAAAEQALSQRQNVIYGGRQPESSAERLRLLRSESARSASDRPNLLSSRFDRLHRSSPRPLRVPPRTNACRARSRIRATRRADAEQGFARSTQLQRPVPSSRELHRRRADGDRSRLSKYRSLVSDMEAALRVPPMPGKSEERAGRSATSGSTSANGSPWRKSPRWPASRPTISRSSSARTKA